MLIDTHAHLTAPEFAEDLVAVLERASAAGVGRVICIGSDVPTSQRAVELAQRDERVYATVGVHPNCLANAPEGWQVTIGRLARHPRVVAIGETGLDYHRDLSPRSLQAGALEWHCALADEVDLPIVVHNRDSDSEVTAALRHWVSRRLSSGPPGVLHSFCGSAEMMRACGQIGFAVSFSGMVTFPNKSLAYLADVAREVPREALLVETDSPYLAPTPLRGRRNEPAFVRLVAQRVASLRSMSIEEVEALTTENARRVFPRLGKAEDG